MHKALTYAEETLGVHAVYEQAEDLIDQVDHLYETLEGFREYRRTTTESIEGREMDLALEYRGNYPDESISAFDRRMKGVLHNDSMLEALRTNLSRNTADIETCEHDIRVREMRIKVKTARIEQLGGYFRYLAFAKANTANEDSEADKTGATP